MLWILVLLVSTSQLSSASAAACTPCPNPEDSYEANVFDQEVEIPGVGLQTCGFVETTLPSVLQQGTEQCTIVQSIGTFCGCPVADDACSGFCSDYDHDAKVENFLGFQGYTASCTMVKSYLQSFTEGSEECSAETQRYSARCGCGGEIPDDEEDGGSRVGLFKPFSLCPDGSYPEFVDKNLAHLLEGESNEVVSAASAFVINGTFTCGRADELARGGFVPDDSVIRDSEEQRLAAGECGCPPVKNACEFCPTHDITKPDEVVPLTRVLFGVEGTCGDLERMLTQFEKTDDHCWTVRNFAFLCGCNGGTPWYLGADSETEHKTLAWIPRVSGFFSFVGSLYIIQDVLRKRFRSITGGITTYQMIMLGMSIFDLSSSMAWMVSTAAIPEYDEERESDSGIYGAVGSEASCKAQGFFLELGFIGSTAFNAVLTTFYLLTIVYGYRDAKTMPLRKYFMAIPSVLAVSLASAAIPFYEPFYVACLVQHPNSEVDRYAHEWKYLIIFSILPIGISMLVSFGNLLAIVRFVFVQNRKADRWRFGSHSFFKKHESKPDGDESSTDLASSLASATRHARTRVTWSRTEAAVFWQAFWYVMAFLLTWVIYLIGQFKPYFSSEDEKLYSFWITLLILNPLMGFWNAFVYIKPWTWLWEQQRRIQTSSTRPASSQGSEPKQVSIFGNASSNNSISLPNISSLVAKGELSVLSEHYEEENEPSAMDDFVRPRSPPTNSSSGNEAPHNLDELSDHEHDDPSTKPSSSDSDALHERERFDQQHKDEIPEALLSPSECIE